MNGGSEIDTTFRGVNPSFGSKFGLIGWKMRLSSEECSATFESS